MNDLVDNVLRVFDNQLSALTKDARSETKYRTCFTIAHDLKYLARPECLQFCIQNTTLVQ